MNQTGLVSTSTIAMTVCSLLSVIGPSDLERVWGALVKADFEIDRAPLREALEQCVERRLVTREGEVFASTLPHGWVVRSRSESDPSGWGGWVAHSPDGRKRLLSNLQLELA